MLCVNAGIGLGGPFADRPPTRTQMVDLNVRGPIRLTQLVLKDMVAGDRGSCLHLVISATMPGSSVEP